jgi:hypothetical protein
MGNRNLITLVTLLTVGLGYQTAGPSKSKQSETAAAPPHGAATRIAEVKGNQEFYVPGTKLLGGPYEKYLLALVPDPVRTRLSLQFDRVVDSLISAASDSGYTYQTAFVPWERNSYMATDDPALRTQQRKEDDYRKSLPGVLVFSGEQKLDQLAIFLVAESPTKGVDRTQFKAAVDRVGAGCRYNIVGPAYSGSLLSLADHLDRVVPDHLPQRIVATGLTGKLPADLFRMRFKDVLHFRTTLKNDDDAWKLFLDYLGDHNKARLARLSETETVFGGAGRPPEAEKSAALTPAQPSPPGAAQDMEMDELSVRFPRGISQLRNAYQDSVSTPAEKPRLSSSPEGLPLLLKDAAQTGDTVPTFGVGQTALSEEALLGQIGRLLREEHVELAQVAATDVFDALFVSKYLRTASPNIRLAFLDADLMYTRAAEELPFTGLLSISQYPLLPLYTKRNKVAPNHALFASTLAEAVYDATRC